MLKKVINYSNFNGEAKQLEAYFHLSEDKIALIESSYVGGLTQKIKEISNAETLEELVILFKEFIDLSYGQKSDDGERFIQEDENGKPLINDFKQTAAYGALFLELASNDKLAADFINGIIPQSMHDRAKEIEAAENKMNHPTQG